MREIKVYAPAKLNLYLNVLKKRPDGFHNIETIFEKIDLKDEIIIKEKGRGLKVRVDAADYSQGKYNIVYKAACGIFKEAGAALNLDIEIKKRIPVSAGLGGGSSNAASTLLGLNYLWNLGLSAEELKDYASRIGSDAAFFVYNYPNWISELTIVIYKNIGHINFHI